MNTTEASWQVTTPVHETTPAQRKMVKMEVTLSKSSDKELYQHLSDHAEQLKEYFVKFCGEQYRDKIEDYFKDCKVLVIDKTCANVQNQCYDSPEDTDSSPLFNMQILQYASDIAKSQLPEKIEKNYAETVDIIENNDVVKIERKSSEPLDFKHDIVSIIKENKDLIKDAIDRFYSSLFSMIKNNTEKRAPSQIYNYAFGDAIKPVFVKIIDDVLKRHNIAIKDMYRDLFEDYTVNDAAHCCAKFDFWTRKDPSKINKVAKDLFMYSAGDVFTTVETPEKYTDLASEIRWLGDYFVEQIIVNIQSSYDSAKSIADNEEYGEILNKYPQYKNLPKHLDEFCKEIKTNGLAVKFREDPCPVLLIENGSHEKTIVHEITHGISFSGVSGILNSWDSLNEVLTEFIARGVCRLMRKDGFSILDNGKTAEASSSYSLGLQHIKEFTSKYKDILLKAYLENDIWILIIEFGKDNMVKLDTLLNDLMRGDGYYNENHQTQFEDLFESIEDYRKIKTENENESDM